MALFKWVLTFFASTMFVDLLKVLAVMFGGAPPVILFALALGVPALRLAA